MDAIDRKIVAALQRDGRMKISELCEIVGLTQTPCARRVERLEADGIITGYAAQVDLAKFGFPITIFISVELERQDRAAIDAFETAIRRCEEVTECYLMTGARDILLRVVAADLGHFDRFLEEKLMKVPGIRNMRSNFALRTMVRREAVPHKWPAGKR